MRIPSSAGYALSVAATITLLAACSGGSSAVQVNEPFGDLYKITHQAFTSKQTKGWMRPAEALTPLTYVSDLINNNVTIFDRNGKVQGHIEGLPHPDGLFVDGKHNLWVANVGRDMRAGNILEFTRGSISPSKTLNDPNEIAYDVTICPNGTVYVSNNVLGDPDGRGSITVYAGGSTNPTGTLKYPGQFNSDYVTCDAAGNVFTTLDRSLYPAVVEYVGGNQSGVTLLPITLSAAGGIKPDNAGNLLINDPVANTITEYTEAGLATGISISTGSDICFGMSVTRDGKIVGCAIDDAPAPSRGGQSFTFPAGALGQTYTASFSRPFGIAFDPGQMGLGY